ncbi:hypothetical protein, partial [Leucobacter sp. M11]
MTLSLILRDPDTGE